MGMKQLKLKPCPFCGSVGEVHKKENLGTYIVECTNYSCPASYMVGYDYESVEEAVEAWNTRQEVAIKYDRDSEIVRCKDCIYHHYTNDSNRIPYCELIDYGYGWKDDEFCSRGKRR